MALDGCDKGSPSETVTGEPNGISKISGIAYHPAWRRWLNDRSWCAIYVAAEHERGPCKVGLASNPVDLTRRLRFEGLSLFELIWFPGGAAAHTVLDDLKTITKKAKSLRDGRLAFPVPFVINAVKGRSAAIFPTLNILDHDGCVKMLGGLNLVRRRRR